MLISLFRVARIEDFSSLPDRPGSPARDRFDVALVFSTKYQPPHPLLGETIGTRGSASRKNSSATIATCCRKISPNVWAERLPIIKSETASGSRSLQWSGEHSCVGTCGDGASPCPSGRGFRLHVVISWAAATAPVNRKSIANNLLMAGISSFSWRLSLSRVIAYPVTPVSSCATEAHASTGQRPVALPCDPLCPPWLIARGGSRRAADG